MTTPARWPALLQALFAASALAAGCSAHHLDLPDADADATGPFVVGDRFVYFNRDWSELWTLRPSASSQAMTVEISVDVLDDEVVTWNSTSRGDLLLLSTSENALTRFPAADAEEPVRYPLNSAYDALYVDPGGRFVIAGFGPTSSGAGDDIFFNPNSVTLIDLDAPSPDLAAHEFTLRGPRPLGFEFVEPFTLGPDRTKRYAVVIGENALSFLDLLIDAEADAGGGGEWDPDLNRQRLVRLTDPLSSRTVTPRSIVFSSDDPSDPNDVKCFVQVSGATEIFAIDILPSEPGSDLEIHPSINQVSTGSSLSMYRFAMEEDGEPRDKILVTANGGRQLHVVDVPTGNATRVDIDAVATSALLWQEQIGAGGDMRPMALLYSRGSDVVQFADLSLLSQQGNRAIRALRLSRSVERIELGDSDGFRKAIATYSDGAGVGVINLDSPTEIMIRSNVYVGDYVSAGASLYFAVPQQSRIGVANPVTGDTSQIDIPAPARSVVAAQGANAILVDHVSTAGWVTILPIGTTAIAPAQVHGLFLDRVLDR